MSKTKSPPYVYKVKNNDLLYCLLYERQWLELLQNKPYERLLTYLLEEVKQNEEGEFGKISIKDVIEAISDKRVTKWLPMIFKDLTDLNFDHPELFRGEGSDFLYDLYFSDRYGDSHFHFKLWLNKPLQVYDEFRWHFLKAKFSMDFFWVEKISHDFGNKQLSTTVWMRNGLPNRYRDFLYDRAEFEERFSWGQKYSMNEPEMDKFLKQTYKL